MTNNKKSKNMVQYCQRCKYYHEEVPELKGYKRHEEAVPDDGKDICEKTFRFEKDSVGHIKLSLYTDEQRCEHCEQIIHYHGEIRYQKCADKNRNFLCKDFTPKLIYRLLDLVIFWRW